MRVSLLRRGGGGAAPEGADVEAEDMVGTIWGEVLAEERFGANDELLSGRLSDPSQLGREVLSRYHTRGRVVWGS